jgi:polyvinyl alcohol dehydrogenase (cytochrome)
MAEQGKALTSPESRAVAMFVTGGKSFGSEVAQMQGACAGPAPAFDKPFAGTYWNGWGVDAANRRMQPAAMAGLRADQVPQLKLKWAFGFPGAGKAFAQPTVVGGRIFAGSDSGKVYSLDAGTGCIYWMFKADTPVRSAISIGPVGAKWVAYFGDQHAQAYAVDAATGALLWKVRVEEHPAAMITGAPALYEGRLYVPTSSYEEVTGAAPKYECCKFRGAVTALDAATGKQIWKSYTIAEAPHPVRKNKQGTQLWGPSGAAVWSSPTIDPKRRAVYVTTGDDYSDPPASTSDAFLAFDMDTGKLLWSRQLTAGDAFVVAVPRETIARKPRARISISAARRTWWICRTASARSSPGRNPAWCMHSIRISRAKCCGACVWARAVRSEECSGATRRTAKTSTRLSRTTTLRRIQRKLAGCSR